MTKKIGLGTWQFGKHFWGDVRDEESLEIIKEAIEHNLTLIDTAPVYGDGHSEKIVGKGIKGKREKVFLATKCGLIHNQKGYFHDLTPASLEKELYVSLKNLQTDYLDLYQIHWPDANYPTDKAIETLLKFKDKGLVQEIGVCNLDFAAFKNLSLLNELYSLQIHFSLLNKVGMEPLLAFCHEQKITTITYGTFQGGLLLDKYSSLEDIPQKSAKNIFYQGKNITVWDNIQKIISEEKVLAKKNELSLPQQVLLSTMEESKANYTLIGCRTLKQLNDNLSPL